MAIMGKKGMEIKVILMGKWNLITEVKILDNLKVKIHLIQFVIIVMEKDITHYIVGSEVVHAIIIHLASKVALTIIKNKFRNVYKL